MMASIVCCFCFINNYWLMLTITYLNLYPLCKPPISFLHFTHHNIIHHPHLHSQKVKPLNGTSAASLINSLPMHTKNTVPPAGANMATKACSNPHPQSSTPRRVTIIFKSILPVRVWRGGWKGFIMWIMIMNFWSWRRWRLVGRNCFMGGGLRSGILIFLHFGGDGSAEWFCWFNAMLGCLPRPQFISVGPNWHGFFVFLQVHSLIIGALCFELRLVLKQGGCAKLCKPKEAAHVSSEERA